MIKYRVRETEELRSRYSFLYHVCHVAIDKMIDDSTALVYDIDDGIYFTIGIEHLIPAK